MLKDKKIKTFIKMAEVFSEESPDEQTKVGAVLISKTGRQIASGFNGFLRGAPDHLLPKTRPDKYEYMQHAERNLLYNCLDEGISTRSCTVITTLSPCEECLRACWQAGITTIIYRDLYFSSNDFYLKLPDVCVDIVQGNGYTVLKMSDGKNRSDEEIKKIIENKSQNP
jgi:dCMP deaminase